MPSLWLATCQAWPQLPENLKPFVQTLVQQKVEVVVAPWQDWQEKTDWVLPLCAWDYATHSQEFQVWLERLIQQDIGVFNPLDLVRWNMSKDYLLDLAKVVEVIPTVVLKQANSIAFMSLLQERQWSEVVLKPLIGQSGNAVTKWRIEQANTGVLPELNAYANGLVIQPYIQEIERYGETSMVFFNGVFSHAVKRQPPRGEWRANSAYGVEVFATVPSPSALASAEKVLGSLAVMPTYARVDGTDILHEGRFLLNELEVIEPALYLHTDVEATARFTQAVWQKISFSI